ncbi:hypothetical protein C0995_007856 [Termitomyces sp. Mi166|nr:hypothetical protein C0995_007856 [Termitomyces sp. Mi166\
MPAPYALIPPPPGDWKDIYDNQAIDMSISHNMFIRGLNAVYSQALIVPAGKEKAFAFFCNSLIAMIHHHHQIEEELVFPFYESKLGDGTMSHNVEQHHAFLGGLEDLEKYNKGVVDSTNKYDGKVVIEKLETFADGLVQHLHDELSTLDSSKMRAAFTVKELKNLEASLGKRVLKEVSLTNVLPLGMVLHDKSTAPHDAWAFGPCDVYGKLKPGFGNDAPAA